MTENLQDLVVFQPNPIIFRDLEAGEKDNIEFIAINNSKNPIRLRYKLPTNSSFKLTNTTDFSVSPGLKNSRIITYTGSTKIERTELEVSSPSFPSFTIPVIFYPPSPTIEVDKKDIDLGRISLNVPFNGSFSFSNYGTREAEYTLSSSIEGVNFNPYSGSINSNEVQRVSYTFTPEKLGSFDFEISINVGNCPHHIDKIKVRYSVLDYSIKLYDGNREIKDIEFPVSFFGQNVKKVITIQNNAPIRKAFAIHPPIDPKLKKQPSHKLFTINPCDGVISGNSKIDVVCTFHPLPVEIVDDITIEYNYQCVLEVLKSNVQMRIDIRGSACQLLYQVDQVDFHFGEHLVKTKSSQELVIRNISKHKEINYSIKPVAHFHFYPPKGSIIPGNEAKVLVTFGPNALGDHNAQSHISFNDGILVRDLHLYGTGVSSIRGNVEKVPFWEKSPESSYSARYPSNKFGCTVKELKLKEIRKSIYDKFMRGNANKRVDKVLKEKLMEQALSYVKHKSEIYGEIYTEEEFNAEVESRINFLMSGSFDDVNLGLERAESIEPPLPPDKPISYVKSPRRRAFTAKPGIRSRRKVIKTKPTTNTEISECSKPLSPSQQLLVTCDADEINFGTFAITAPETRCVTFTNKLEQHIFIQLKIEDFPELSNSKPFSQVIPPGSDGVFEIVVVGTEPKKYFRNIRYTINGTFENTISLMGSITPIEVDFNKESVEFMFMHSEGSLTMKDSVRIVNPTKAHAKFKFEGLFDPFILLPTDGVVLPNSSTVIEVIYRPDKEPISEAEVLLKVVGGPSRTLRLFGTTGNPKLSLDKDIIDFKLLPLGITKSSDVTIKNIGKDPAIFGVIPESSETCKISPSQGKIMPGDKIALKLTAKCSSSREINDEFFIQPCGAQPIPFKVIGHAENPMIELEFDNLDFGRVFVGSSEYRDVNIKNVSLIPAVVYLDLGCLEQFCIEFESSLSNNNSSGSQNSIILVKDKNISDFTDIGSKNSSPNINSSRTTSSRPLYKITLLSESSIQFKLVFRPTSVNEYTFELPFMMSDSTSVTSTVQPMVIAESIQAPLVCTPNILDFGLTVLHDPLNPNIRPKVRKLTLENKLKTPVKFRFDYSQVEQFFSIEPLSGEVDYLHDTIVIIRFRPTEARPIVETIFLYAEAPDGEEIMTAKINLGGVGVNKPFVLSSDYVWLPIVPLNIRSERILKVYNRKSVETSLKIHTAVDEATFPLSVTFPEGNSLQYTSTSLPICFSFVCDHPMCFSTKVAITDMNGNSYTVYVSACTDNSVFTLWHVLKPGFYEFKPAHGRSTNLIPSGQVPDDFLGYFLNNLSDFTKISSLSRAVDSVTVNFLIQFLNSFVLTNKITSFPNEFANEPDIKIMEIISNLCGQRKPSFKLEGVTKIARIKSLLTFLMTQGLLVARIRPEFLLTKDEFKRFYHDQLSKDLLGIGYIGAPKVTVFDKSSVTAYTSSKTFTQELSNRIKVVSKLYNNISTEAWFCVICQILKIFLFSKVDADKVLRIPGYQDAIKELKTKIGEASFSEFSRTYKLLLSSNYISPQESSLLKWISTYYCKLHYEGSGSILTRFAQIRDPRTISSLFQGLISNNIHIDSGSEGDVESVRKSIMSLGLNFVPDKNALLDGPEFVLALIAMELFQVLPHYVPSSLILFECGLNETTIQHITITNTAKVEVIYTASIEGSTNFKIESDEITIQPGEAANIGVSYFASNICSDTAKVTLVPSRSTTSSEPILHSSVVFTLQSKVTVKQPQKQFEFTGNLYEPTPLKIPIKNHVKSPGDFKIVTQFTCFEKDGKELPLLSLDEFVTKNRTVEPHDVEDIGQHSAFILSVNNLEFEEGDKMLTLDIEFIPISIGCHTLHILFFNRVAGAFLYEVKATAVSNLTSETTISVKAEATLKSTSSVPIMSVNKRLAYALAYSQTRVNNLKSGEFVTDAKFKDMVNFTLKDVIARLSTKTRTKFEISFSSEYYGSQPEYFLDHSTIKPVSFWFSPMKPGEYPCKMLMQSPFDFRLVHINGTATAKTRNISIDIETTSGRVVTQDIPLTNPSDHIWNFKIDIKGDLGFEVPSRLSVKPNSTSNLTLTFMTRLIGNFSTILTITNLNKDSLIVYNINAKVSEPLAEEKIVLSCKAREKASTVVNIPSFMQDGVAQVTTDVPIIKFTETIRFKEGVPQDQLQIEAITLRSGIAAGTIKITDAKTGIYIWYVIEINIERPPPEQVINVNTIERQPITISFPVKNPRVHPVEFEVYYTDKYLIGSRSVVIPANESVVYSLGLNPLRAGKRTTFVSFNNEYEGEYSYLLDISIEEAEPIVVAPLKSQVGSYASTTIVLENIVSSLATFNVENSNEDAFHLNVKSVFSIQANEKKIIEIKYTPTKIGEKENCMLIFRSKEAGDFRYSVQGTGKPPHALSPQIVEGRIGNNVTSSIVFINPFSFQSTFDVTLVNDGSQAFKLLSRKKYLQYTEYGEAQHVSFAFIPQSKSHVSGSIIISTSRNRQKMSWTYPIVGITTIGKETSTPEIHGKANNPSTKTIELPLVGEEDEYNTEDYHITMEYPIGFEWISSYLEATPELIIRSEGSTTLRTQLKLGLRRPLDAVAHISVENKSKRRWRFPLVIHVDPSEFTSGKQIIIESTLYHVSTCKIFIDEQFTEVAEFHAYFVQPSPSELGLTSSDGVIGVSDTNNTLVPVEITFQPKTYGKLVKGILIIDTEEREYIFEVHGKMPGYIPPVFKLSGRCNPNIGNGAATPRKSKDSSSRLKKNYVKDLFGRIKIRQPRSARQPRRILEM